MTLFTWELSLKVFGSALLANTMMRSIVQDSTKWSQVLRHRSHLMLNNCSLGKKSRGIQTQGFLMSSSERANETYQYSKCSATTLVLLHYCTAAFNFYALWSLRQIWWFLLQQNIKPAGVRTQNLRTIRPVSQKSQFFHIWFSLGSLWSPIPPQLMTSFWGDKINSSWKKRNDVTSSSFLMTSHVFILDFPRCVDFDLNLCPYFLTFQKRTRKARYF